MLDKLDSASLDIITTPLLGLQGLNLTSNAVRCMRCVFTGNFFISGGPWPGFSTGAPRKKGVLRVNLFSSNSLQFSLNGPVLYLFPGYTLP